jgi:endonuclease YncB( thermonuclease family)
MMQCDLGFSVHIEVPIRLTGVDAPELNTPEGEPARLRVSLWFAQHRHAADTAWPYRVDTVRMKRREREKMTFARYLGSVTCSEGHSLSEALGQQGDV